MKKGLANVVAALALYACFAFYLFRPYLGRFDRADYLLVVNPVLAGVGCFLLSRRWVSGFWECVFAGSLYGFGPFLLGLGQYHPTAGSLAAVIPWLLLPAAFGRGEKRQWLRLPLCLFAFVAVVLFFRASAYYRLFPVSVQAKLHLSSLAGVAAVLVTVKRSLNVVGFYHVPLGVLAVGSPMLFKRRRFWVAASFAAGTVLASCDSFLGVGPIMWLAVPVVWCCVAAGLGMQALGSAGAADKGWVLAIAAGMAGLAIAALLLASRYFQVWAGLGDDYARLFVRTAWMYIAGAVAAGIIFFVAGAKLRLRWLRLMVLCSALAADIVSGAVFVVDHIF